MRAQPAPSGPRAAALRATALAAAIAFAAPAGAVMPAASASAAPVPAAPASELAQPSEAERLLFLQPQLAAIHEPRTISYDYVSEGEKAPRTTDQATLALKPAPDGRCCTAHIDFLSGRMAVNLPDLDQPQSNPVLMHFLESEVRLLERETKGQSSHFRRRIRQSLADDATISDTTVRWNGHDVAARVVRVTPFLTDPYRPRFEREAKMEYSFVLSDAVPGGLVRLTATLPGATAGDVPLARRTLSIADPQPTSPARK